MKTQKLGFTLIELAICIVVFIALTTLASYFKIHYRHSAEINSFLNITTPIRSQINQHHQAKSALDSQFCTTLLDQYGAKIATQHYPTVAVACSNRSFLIQKWSNSTDYDNVLEMAGYYQSDHTIQWICHAARATNHTSLGQCRDWSYMTEWMDHHPRIEGLNCNCFDSRTYAF